MHHRVQPSDDGDNSLSRHRQPLLSRRTHAQRQWLRRASAILEPQLSYAGPEAAPDPAAAQVESGDEYDSDEEDAPVGEHRSGQTSQSAAAAVAVAVAAAATVSARRRQGDRAVGASATDTDGDDLLRVEQEIESMRRNSLAMHDASVVPSPRNAQQPARHADGRLRVYCCTWNMHGKLPADASELVPFIKPGEHDVYCIGTQECERSIERSVVVRSKQRWESLLARHFGERYTLLRSNTLMAIHIVVLVRRDLLPFISEIRTSQVSCGISERLPTKGGNAVGFRFGRTSFLFINCHLAAHQSQVQLRNQHYRRIVDEIWKNPSGTNEVESVGCARRCSNGGAPGRVAPMPEGLLSSSSDDIFGSFDRIFLMGDTNYRINGTRSAVDKVIHMGLHEVLLANDQLSTERQARRAFAEFNEGRIRFPPTYKFNKGTDIYDTSKKRRIPAWTDRIVFRSGTREAAPGQKQAGDAISLLEYDAALRVRLSDHKPVFARFLVHVDVGDGTDEDVRGHARERKCSLM